MFVAPDFWIFEQILKGYFMHIDTDVHLGFKGM